MWQQADFPADAFLSRGTGTTRKKPVCIKHDAAAHNEDSMTQPIEIKLPWPDRALSPNTPGKHWGPKAKARAKARLDVAWLLCADGVRKMDADRAHVAITFHAPDKRARDLDNMLATIKPHLDAISDVIGIDDSKWDLSIARGTPGKPGSVHIEVSAA